MSKSILRLSIKILGLSVAVLRLSIAILSLSNTVLSLSNTIQGLSIALLGDKNTIPDAKSSLAKGSFFKSLSKIAFFKTDVGRYAARPGVLKAAAGT